MTSFNDTMIKNVKTFFMTSDGNSLKTSFVAFQNTFSTHIFEIKNNIFIEIKQYTKRDHFSPNFPFSFQLNLLNVFFRKINDFLLLLYGAHTNFLGLFSVK